MWRIYWEILDIIKHYSFGSIFFWFQGHMIHMLTIFLVYFLELFWNFLSFHNQMSTCAFKHLHSKLISMIISIIIYITVWNLRMILNLLDTLLDNQVIILI